jgi:integrase
VRRALAGVHWTPYRRNFICSDKLVLRHGAALGGALDTHLSRCCQLVQHRCRISFQSLTRRSPGHRWQRTARSIDDICARLMRPTIRIARLLRTALQLRLRERLAAAGRIRYDDVFVHANGEPMQDSQIAAVRWRKTLLSLKVRHRRPYTARHSSVSWNLMLGKNALRVAKQHGHSIMTMLRTYAAWTGGAVEADVQRSSGR